MFVLWRLDIFESGKFIRQIRRFVNEHRQALRADEGIVAFIMQVDERNLLFGFLTVQTSFHLVACKVSNEMVKARRIIPHGMVTAKLQISLCVFSIE